MKLKGEQGDRRTPGSCEQKKVSQEGGRRDSLRTLEGEHGCEWAFVVVVDCVVILIMSIHF